MVNTLSDLDYSGVIALLNDYARKKHGVLTEEQDFRLRAVIAMLADLDFLSKSIIQTTNALMQTRLPILEAFRGLVDTPEIRKKHPEIDALLAGKLRLVQSTSVVAYPTDQPAKEPQQRDWEKRLELDTENYYLVANRLIDWLQDLPDFRGFKCESIQVVRNRLIEHRGEISLDSFQYGDVTGPVIKGLRRTDHPENPRDRGFILNSQTFLRELMAALRRTLSRS